MGSTSQRWRKFAEKQTLMTTNIELQTVVIEVSYLQQGVKNPLRINDDKNAKWCTEFYCAN